MTILTLESNVLGEFFDLDFCVRVFIELSVSGTRDVQFDTPFGPSYRWHEKAEIEAIYYEFFKVNGDKKELHTNCALEFYKSNKDFKEEVDKKIERFLDSSQFTLELIEE